VRAAVLGHEGAGVVEQAGDGSADTTRLIPQLLGWYRDGARPAYALLGEQHGLEQVDEACARLPAQSAGRGVTPMGEQ
jgi:Zn-dependent alcohol dehydrogenase